MLKKLLSNWPLKLLSVVLAILVWFVIISLADPSDVRTIYNIPVNLLHEDLLKQAGKSYTVEGGESPRVNVRVSAAKSLLNGLKASDFTATANIEEMIDINGAVPIKVSCSHPSISDSQITPMSSSVTIKYESIVSKIFTVSVESPETPPEGYFVGNLSSTPPSVRVTAPSSVLDRIGSVVAEVDVSQMTESGQLEASLRYFTNTGEELRPEDYKDTRVSTDSTMVNVEIQTMKVLPVVISQEAVEEMKSQVPDGYRYNDHTKLPDVRVKGLKSRLADLTAITIPPGSLSLKNATEDKTVDLDLNFFLPEGLELMEGEERLFSVTIYVAELVVRDFTVRGLRLIGEEKGYRYEYNPAVTVSIRGLEADFQGFDPATISLSVDVTDYASNPGKYILQVEVHCEDETIFTPLPGPRLEVTVKSETPPTRSTTTPPATAPTTAPAETEAHGATVPATAPDPGEEGEP